MIIRVEIELDSGTLKYQMGRPKHTAHDSAYLFKLLVDSDIEIHGNLGDGWKQSTFSFVLDDIDKTIFNSTDIWQGRKIIVRTMREEYSAGTWSLVEKDCWVGSISDRLKDKRGRVSVQASESQGFLGKIIPGWVIDSPTFPAAVEAALGKRVQILTGTHSITGGALVAWHVGGGRYLAAMNTLKTVTGIYDGTVSIPNTYWQTVIGTDGETYIAYTPPTGVEGIPEDAPDCLYFNCVATENANPIVALKTAFDTALGTGVFFTGNSTIETEFDTREYQAALGLGMGDEAGDIVTEFCSNFDTYATIGTDGRLQLGFIDPTPVATFTTNILSVYEKELSAELGNNITLAWQYDHVKNKFAREDLYSHPSSINDYGQKDRTFEFFFTGNEATALDVTRRRTRQLREVPREIDLRVTFDDQASVKVGNVIAVNSANLLRSGTHKYVVRSKTIHRSTGSVTLNCRSFFDGLDYFIRIVKNYDGGAVTPCGLVVLSAGQSLTATADPYTTQYQELDYIWLDFSTKITGQLSYTISSIAADHDLVFAFKTSSFLITASDDGNCTINPKGDVYVPAGSSKTFTATPAAGKVFSHFMVDGVKITGSNSYTFSNVTGPHSIVAYSTTVPVQYITLTITKSGSGTISPRAAGVYQIAAGSPVWMTFSPNATAVHVNGSLFATNTNGVSLGKLYFDTTVEVTF